jgi:hypothetical protein
VHGCTARPPIASTPPTLPPSARKTPAYKTPAAPPSLPLFSLARDASRRKKSLIGVRLTYDRVLPIPVRSRYPTTSPRYQSSPHVRAHLRDFPSNLILQPIKHGDENRGSPTPTSPPVVLSSHSRMKSTTPFTPLSSSRHTGHRRGLAISQKSPEHHRCQPPSRSLAGAAHRNPR